MPNLDGRRRVVIDAIRPQIDCGRFAVKRTLGERVAVEADIFTDGHDEVAAELRWRPVGERRWRVEPMEPLENDRWRGGFAPEDLGEHRYTVAAWVDPFATWAHGLEKKVAAEQDVGVDLMIGAELVEAAAGRARGGARTRLSRWAERLRGGSPDVPGILEELVPLMREHPDRSTATRAEPDLPVVVDRERARFSTWYELFPRSAASEPGRHGTFADVEARLPYVARMGFDVLYLPPIHPIGRAHRKGPNNRRMGGPDDPGVPWAIGGDEGGHRSVHPELGTLEDFRGLVDRASELGIEVALDLAFQASPDHPWVKKHPEWFRARPDGTIQYAENPPKRYEDIYPLDFESEAWPELWNELEETVRFWIDQGVRIFRVDNPHTKPFAFWQWLIERVKGDHPDLIFLSEAFTRPKVMYRLAKLGFTQSYTYFAWRTTKHELTEYLTELTRTEAAEFFRPNLWPNTPDILTEQLQVGGRPTFVSRLVLAATLGASYGIYGPAYELMESEPREPGSEEYLDSEKYEIRHWDLERRESLAGLIATVNEIRRENPALQTNRTLRFHPVDNDALIAYSKASDDGDNVLLTVVNLDPHRTQAGWVELPLRELGIDPSRSFQAHDLLTDARYEWRGGHNYVELDPAVLPAHVLRLGRPLRTERDFEYFQ